MLNAFRHHRGGHTMFWSCIVLLKCAQRLSASQRGACRRRPPMPPLDKMCSTPFGITEGGIHKSRSSLAERRHVLNAFRHHRGGHVLVFEDRVISRVCSTPFGITEGGIRPACPSPRPARVLNAFRHHRGGHRHGGQHREHHVGCSTPFGITEGGIPVAGGAVDQLKECSTPFGITEGGMRSRN